MLCTIVVCECVYCRGLFLRVGDASVVAAAIIVVVVRRRGRDSSWESRLLDFSAPGP